MLIDMEYFTMKKRYFLWSTTLSVSAALLPFSAHAKPLTHAAPHHHKKASKKAPITNTASTTPTAIPTIAPAPTSSPSAVAQTLNNATITPSGVEQITVTGSRLIKNSLDQVEPITTLGSDQIRKRGYTNIALALLREDTAFAPSSSPIGNQSGNGMGSGQSFANLFNLGAEHTLTVVNGLRFTPGSSASMFGNVSGSAVDLTEIPDSLVDRSEVVKTGGAPTYGSDAIAGTVNLILKNDFQGLQVDGQAGWTQQLDGLSHKIDFLAGRHFDHDRGGIVVDVEYTHNDSISGNSRYFSGADQPWLETVSNKPYENALSTQYRSLLFTQSGIPNTSDVIPFQGSNQSGITNAAGQTLIFSKDGKSLVPLTYNSVDAYGYNASGGNGLKSNAFNNLMSDVTRVSFVTLGHYNFSNNLRFHWETWYERYNSINPANSYYMATAQYGNAGQVNGNFPVSINSPFLTSTEQNTIQNALNQGGTSTNQFYVADASTQIMNGRYESQNELYRFVTGLDGNFDALHRNWKWEATFQYGRNAMVDMQNEPLIQNLNNALNVTTNAAGQAICSPGYTSASVMSFSSTCAPFNPIGTNQASQQSVNYIDTQSKDRSVNTMLDFVADIKGNVMQLPAGQWQVVAGYEHRRESNAYDPGPYLESGEGISIPVLPSSGAYHTNEAFAETDIPLVKPSMHIPFIYHASANSSMRYIDNSYTGAFWTYAAGGTLSFTKDIAVRGSYMRSLRAPGVAELVQPLGASYESGNDPCDTNYINGGTNPAMRAHNCAVAGVPQGFLSNISNFSVKGLGGGNPHLTNEQGTAKSIGAVITPRWIPGLTLQADYMNIRINNQITQPGVQYDMDACYDSADFPNNSYCQLFTRNKTTHQITNFTDTYQNVGVSKVRLLQAVLNYQLPLQRIGLGDDSGAINTSINYTHYFNNYYVIGGSTQYQFGGSGNPADNFTANLNYSWRDAFFQWQTQYYGRSSTIVNQSSNYFQYPKAPSFALFNMTIGYTFAKKYTASFMVNNVLGSSPPFPYQFSTTRYYNAILGRSFGFNISANF